MQEMAVAALMDPNYALKAADKVGPAWPPLPDKERVDIKECIMQLANKIVGLGNAGRANAEWIIFVKSGFPDFKTVATIQVGALCKSCWLWQSCRMKGAQHYKAALRIWANGIESHGYSIVDPAEDSLPWVQEEPSNVA